jgi:hypothetical protein
VIRQASRHQRACGGMAAIAMGPRFLNYRVRGWRGFGDAAPLSYYDLLAQAGLQSCDPKDSTCVSNNVAKQAAVEDLWTSKYMVTGAPAGTTLSFTPQTAAQVNEFYNASNVSGGDVVDTRGILSVNGAVAPSSTGLTPTQFFGAAKAPPSVAAKVPAVRAGALQPGSALVPAGESNGSLPAGSGFAFSSIPAWGWLAAAGVAVFAMSRGN